MNEKENQQLATTFQHAINAAIELRRLTEHGMTRRKKAIRLLKRVISVPRDVKVYLQHLHPSHTTHMIERAGFDMLGVIVMSISVSIVYGWLHGETIHPGWLFLSLVLITGLVKLTSWLLYFFVELQQSMRDIDVAISIVKQASSLEPDEFQAYITGMVKTLLIEALVNNGTYVTLNADQSVKDIETGHPPGGLRKGVDWRPITSHELSQYADTLIEEQRATQSVQDDSEPAPPR